MSMRNTRAGRSIVTAAGFITALAAMALNAEEWVLPAASGVINVVTDYGVDNSGQTDVTALLNEVMADANKRQAVYFPKGTYLVSGSVFSPDCGPGGTTTGPVIVGESRTGSVIRLADGTWPSGTIDATAFPNYHDLKDRVVLNGGDCGNTAFGKEMRNFTVDIGSNNDGAIGLNWGSANYGGVAEIDVISQDGKGCIGLSVSGVEVGPGLVRGVHVKGFRTGVYVCATDDITLSQIVLEDQTEYGLVNAWGCGIDSIKFTSSVANAAAVLNRGMGRLVVLNGYFSGTSSSAALVNQSGSLFARNIHSSGFSRALSSSGTPVAAPDGAYLEEYASHGSAGMWYTPGRSMNLPIKYAPYPPWEQDTSKWCSIKAYKGGTAIGQRVYPDTQAVRQAFTTPGKTSVCVDFAGYTAADTVFIEGDIERVFGTVGELICPAMVIRNNTAPVVVVQMIQLAQEGLVYGTCINRSSSTVILEGVNANIIAEGTGDLFVNGNMGRFVARNPQQKVWVRGFNGEGVWEKPLDSTDIMVGSGQVWLMGYKTENAWGKAYCSGGFLEMFSILAYRGCQDVSIPLFRVSGDGQFSMASLTQVSHAEPLFPRLVWETRNGEDRILTNQESPGGYNLTLYTGYNKVPDPAASATPKITGRSAIPSIAALPGKRLSVALDLSSPSAVGVHLVDMRGRVLALQAAGHRLGAGPQEIQFDLSHIPAGAYCVEVATSSGRQSQRMVLAK